MIQCLANREICKSVICGIVPQAGEWRFKFCASGECLGGSDGEIVRENWTLNNDTERRIQMNTEETDIKNTDEYIEKLFCGRGLSSLQVATAVADVASVPLGEIRNDTESSDPKVTDARDLAMYLARKCTSNSLPEIAGFFNCMHALILFKVSEMRRRLLAEDSLRGRFDLIVARLQDICK